MVLKSECTVDNPGEITWHEGKGPRNVLGPCPHDCPHEMGWTVADGPDREHYTLDECVMPDGCNGDCRAWNDWAARPVSPWLHVGEAVTTRGAEATA